MTLSDLFLIDIVRVLNHSSSALNFLSRDTLWSLTLRSVIDTGSSFSTGSLLIIRSLASCAAVVWKAQNTEPIKVTLRHNQPSFMTTTSSKWLTLIVFLSQFSQN